MAKITTTPLKTFHIKIFDERAYYNFFTEAKDHKKALRNLQTNSNDYKQMCSNNNELTIKVTQI